MVLAHPGADKPTEPPNALLNVIPTMTGITPEKFRPARGLFAAPTTL